MFPIYEEQLYSYLSMLREEKAPASSAQSTIEAVNFTMGLLEITDTQKPTFSRRVQGCALTCMDQKRIQETAIVFQEPSLEVDEGEDIYIESKAARTKPGSSKKKRRLALPLVGLAAGESGKDWARAWLNARVLAGLDAEVDGHLMPAPLPSGGFSKRFLIGDEARVWMKEILISHGVAAAE